MNTGHKDEGVIWAIKWTNIEYISSTEKSTIVLCHCSFTEMLSKKNT